MSRLRVGRLMLLLFCLAVVSCAGPCPSRETVTAAVKKIMPVGFEVAETRSMAEVPGLCEVIITVNKQPVVFYMDGKGKYVVSGSIMEIQTGRNITLESQQKYKK